MAAGTKAAGYSSKQSNPKKSVKKTSSVKPNNKSRISEKDSVALKTNDARKTGAGFPVVGIGASAGGLEAFESFFKAMPPNSGMAFVLVSHLSPDHASILPELLQKSSPMSVKHIKNGEKVQPNFVYVIPPNKDLAISKGALQLTSPTGPHAANLPIDSFFRSLAQDQGANAVCIIMSGTGRDGTLGLSAIKGEGGLVIAQDEKSAKYDGMPKSAIATGMVDYVLNPKKMPEQLIKYAQHAFVKESPKVSEFEDKSKDTLSEIYVLLRNRTGHDFSLYKKNTICRRIERRLRVNQIDNISEYAKYLQKSESELDILFKDFLIGVTNFFRDPEAFDSLRDNVFPKILENKPDKYVVRVWTPGCSSGEEAYSISIVLQESMKALKRRFNVQIFGTDIDDNAVNIARAGLYPSAISVDVSPERLQKYFTKEDDSYRIGKQIRETVVFASQDVIKDPPFTKLDLICCRNLLIYLGADTQKKLLPVFHYSLKPDGFLFLGASESIGQFDEFFAPLDKKWKIFKRKEVSTSARVFLDLPASSQDVYPTDKAEFPTTVKKSEELSGIRLVETILKQTDAPPCAVINDSGEIVYIHGRTGSFLEPAEGRASVNILDMARPGLKTELAEAIRSVNAFKQEVVYRNLKVRSNGGHVLVDLIVKPILDENSLMGMMMVAFQESSPRTAKGSRGKKGSAPFKMVGRKKSVEELELELRRVRETLQEAIEKLQITNEEYKSANEELQSTNEELETSKEEMQSLNEETITINAELQNRIEELNRVHSDMKNLFEGAQIATLFLDTDMRVKLFTPKITDIIPLTATDIGRPIQHFVSSLIVEDLAQKAQEVLKTLEKKEIEVQSKDDKYFNIRILPYRTLNNIIDGVVITFNDVTERRRAELEMKRSEEKYRLLFEHANDAIFISDPRTHEFLDVNRKATEWLGYSRDELLKMSLLKITPPDLADDLDEKLDRIAETEHFVVETVHTRKDGSEINVEISSRLVEYQGQKVIQLLARDVTDRKRFEEESIKVQKLESIGVLAGGIAHDFNNLLTAILGNIQLVRMNTATGSDNLDLLQEAETACDRARDLTRRLITFAKGGSPVKKVASIGGLIKESADFALRGSNVLSHISIPDDLWMVDYDDAQINQVLHNIFINAAQSMPEGGTIKISARNLTLDQKSDHRDIPLENGKYVMISIRDIGAGITKENLTKIFDPYFSTKQTGRGLGLATSYSIIKRHGGYINVESDLGKGSIFNIYLPASELQAPLEVAKGEIISGYGKILLMDDEELVQKIAGRMLEKLGYEVEFASTGEEAIEMFKDAFDAGAPYDALILDLTVPGGMGGKKAVEKILEIDPDAKAIVSSGYSTDPVMANCKAYGFSGILVKPYLLEKLSELLHRIIDEDG